MQIQRGMRGKLDQYVRPDQAIEVAMDVDGGAVYDYCCFGVDGGGKLSDDRYMVFYNQTRSPGGGISKSCFLTSFAGGGAMRFAVAEGGGGARQRRWWSQRC